MKLSKRLCMCGSALLALMFSCGCGPQEHADHGTSLETARMTLGFAGRVGEQAFSCERAYTLGSAESSVEFTDFKLYLAEVRLVREGGEEVDARIVEMEPWQSQGVALLDFEDGRGACSNGTHATRTRIEIEAPEYEDYVGVKATLGVPFELNHADVGELPSPLNVPGMFWSWQGGRKFMRIDARVEGSAGMRVHLGSIACQGSNGDISGCDRENRGQIALMGKDPLSHQIEVDLEGLFGDLDLTPAGDSSVICMSAPGTPVCEPIFSAMGVKYEDGSTSAATQRMMRLSDEPFDASMNTDKE